MKLILQMIGVTMVMILAAGGAVVGVVGLFLAEATSLRLLSGVGAAVGVSLAALGVWALIQLNYRWLADFRQKFDDAPSEVLAHWAVSPEQWQALAEYEKREARETAPFAAAVIFCIVGALTAFGCWSSLGSATALTIALVAGGISAVGPWLAVRLGGTQRYLRDNVQNNEVLLRPDGMLVRGTIVAWGSFSGTLEKFEWGRLEGLDFAVLTVEVRQPCGDSHCWHTYRIPLPEGVDDLSATLAQRWSDQVSSTAA